MSPLRVAWLATARPFAHVTIAEVDEIFLLESFKGQRKLPRAARERGGDLVLPDRSEAAVRPVLEGKLSLKLPCPTPAVTAA